MEFSPYFCVLTERPWALERSWGLETGANFISSISKMEEYFNKVVAVQFKSASRENR